MMLIFYTISVLAWQVAAKNAACLQGLYAALTPLAEYAPALSYCSAKYPPTTDVITTTLVARNVVRYPATTGGKSSSTTKSTTKSTTISSTRMSTKSTTPVKPSTKTTTSYIITTKSLTTSTKSSTITTKSLNAKESQWSSILQQAGSIIATLCDCIESHPTSTRIVTPTTTARRTTTSSSSSASTSSRPTPAACVDGACPDGCACLNSAPGGQPGCYVADAIYPVDCVYGLAVGSNFCNAGYPYCVYAPPGQGTGDSGSGCAGICTG